ncbi:centromere protein Q isoform X2 [Acinonyx jubatus]|uniref:Centromere protein Q n=1 Tax=Acinonyx jubatus TaxID=32536 RepID=A0A6I9ZSH2_ACIJB|nr:centromere protein Q isoform X2 [Acinonyx jubatus]
MSNKAGASKKRPQQLKKNPKRKTDDEEVELPERKVRNTAKNKNPKHLLSEVTGQAEHTNLKRVKVAFNKRKTWQPLSKGSREHLQAMMESVIITILSNNIREHEQVQYHLNYLKKRLLQLCENLKVPPKKLKDLTNVSSLLKMERAEHRANEEGLALLQMFQIDSGVLCLPELSQKSLKAPTLQKEILTFIPNHNALLKDLDVLHNSPQMKNMLTFIEEAYKRLDAS